MLRLHAESVAELINPAAFALEGAIEKVAGVELQTRLAREHFQHASGGRFGNARNHTKFSQGFVDHPIMIVAVAELELFVWLVDARADGGWFAKIQRRAFH